MENSLWAPDMGIPEVYPHRPLAQLKILTISAIWPRATENFAGEHVLSNYLKWKTFGD